MIEVIIKLTITDAIIHDIIIEAILIDPVIHNIIIDAFITETIITEAVIHTIVIEEGGGSVDHRLECDCLVLAAARVDDDDAGDVLRSQDTSDFASEREIPIGVGSQDTFKTVK
jgi:hypothetical protein